MVQEIKLKEMPMTKGDLTTQIARNLGITRADTAEVLNAFLKAISSALEQGQKIEIRGFGVFKVKQRKGRAARNPRTGQKIWVSPRLVPVFKPSDHLKDRVMDND